MLHDEGIVYVISSGDMVIMGRYAAELQALVSSMALSPSFQHNELNIYTDELICIISRSKEYETNSNLD